MKSPGAALTAAEAMEDQSDLATLISFIPPGLSRFEDVLGPWNHASIADEAMARGNTMKIKTKCPDRNDAVQGDLAPTPSEMYPIAGRYVREPKSEQSSVQIVRAKNGGALRTFHGGLAHENGWFNSAKARRLLHFEGVAQRDFLLRAEVEPGVANMASEAVRFEFARTERQRDLHCRCRTDCSQWHDYDCRNQA